MTLSADSVVLIALAAAIVCGGVVACHRSGPDEEEVRVQAHAKAHRVWGQHVETLRGILRGREFSQDGFVRAMEFFEGITGIPSRHNRSYFGGVPNEYLRADLDRWQAWYSENKTFLCWDSATGEVRLDKGKKRGCGDSAAGGT